MIQQKNLIREKDLQISLLKKIKVKDNIFNYKSILFVKLINKNWDILFWDFINIYSRLVKNDQQEISKLFKIDPT